jgi:hypothetical protein
MLDEIRIGASKSVLRLKTPLSMRPLHLPVRLASPPRPSKHQITGRPGVMSGCCTGLNRMQTMPQQTYRSCQINPAGFYMTPFPAPQPWDASDPLPVMRREMKLLLIELNVLQVEVEQLRAMNQDARNTAEFLTTSLNQLSESRDQWQREAERLHSQSYCRRIDFLLLVLVGLQSRPWLA